MRAGRLRNRITVMEHVEEANALGQVKVIPTPKYKRWAFIEPLEGSELINAQQMQSDVTHRVSMRYSPEITSRMKLQYGDRTLEVVVPLNIDERNKETVLMCKEAI